MPALTLTSNFEINNLSATIHNKLPRHSKLSPQHCTTLERKHVDEHGNDVNHPWRIWRGLKLVSIARLELRSVERNNGLILIWVTWSNEWIPEWIPFFKCQAKIAVKKTLNRDTVNKLKLTKLFTIHKTSMKLMTLFTCAWLLSVAYNYF